MRKDAVPKSAAGAFFKIIDPKKKFRMNFKYRDVPKGSHPKDV